MNPPAAFAENASRQQNLAVTAATQSEEGGTSRIPRIRSCTDGIEQMLRLLAGVADHGAGRNPCHGPPSALLRPLDAATGFSAWAIEEVTDRAVRVELAALRRRQSLLDLGFVESVATGRTWEGGSQSCAFLSDRYLLGALVAGLCEVASAFSGGNRPSVGASIQHGWLVLRVRGCELLRAIPEVLVVGSALQGAIESLRIHTIQRAMRHLNAVCVLDDSALPTTQLEIRIPVS